MIDATSINTDNAFAFGEPIIITKPKTTKRLVDDIDQIIRKKSISFTIISVIF